ncbi:MAG: DUF465 domain-containing protein [Gammaproteobacteria bacterium]|nr:DUF465 domain-containing protein [Gammaproteobacteria bacterium]
MLEHHHDLSREFPEFKTRIHEFKQNDRHLIKLYDQYQEIDKELFRIEEGIETPSDEYTETLKKRRLKIKDELYAMLSK